MKAISLWQPWASLIMCGAKAIETRSWSTGYRGPLLIHAAKKWDRAMEDLCWELPFAEALNRAGLTPETLPLGSLLGTATLVTVESTEDAVAAGAVGPRERAFGDYTPGRWAWRLANPKPFAAPALYRGERLLFEVPDDVLSTVQETT